MFWGHKDEELNDQVRTKFDILEKDQAERAKLEKAKKERIEREECMEAHKAKKKPMSLRLREWKLKKT